MSIIIFLQHLTESLQQRCRLQQPWLRMAKSGCFLDFGYSGNDNALVSVFKKTPTGEAGTSVGLHKSFQNWSWSGSRLYNSSTARCLDVASNTNGGAVVIADCGDSVARPYQVWPINGNSIYNQQSGMCLDVSENKDAGAVVIYHCHGTVDL